MNRDTRLIWERHSVKEADLSHGQYKGPSHLEPYARIEPQEMESPGDRFDRERHEEQPVGDSNLYAFIAKLFNSNPELSDPGTGVEKAATQIYDHMVKTRPDLAKVFGQDDVWDAVEDRMAELGVRPEDGPDQTL